MLGGMRGLMSACAFRSVEWNIALYHDHVVSTLKFVTPRYRRSVACGVLRLSHRVHASTSRRKRVGVRAAVDPRPHWILLIAHCPGHELSISSTVLVLPRPLQPVRRLISCAAPHIPHTKDMLPADAAATINAQPVCTQRSGADVTATSNEHSDTRAAAH